MSKVYNDEIKDLVTKLSAINSSDFESILKAVEAEKEFTSNTKMPHIN